MKVIVYLMKRDGRTNFECQWKDPITGRLKTRSTKTPNRREAERFAGALEADLNEGANRNIFNTKWAYLADRYESEVLASRARKTQYKFTGMRRWLTRLIDPEYAVIIDADLISKFQHLLRKEGQAEASIKGHLSTLRACLNWAFKLKLIAQVPHFAMPRRINYAKGRPLTDGEFQTYLQKLYEVVGPNHFERFEELVLGLWLSGLRLDEAIRLTWEPTCDGINVDLSGNVPRLRIEANEDKNTKAKLLPIAPDFAEFLLGYPVERRCGRVFRPTIEGMRTEFLRSDTCGDILRRAGEKAEIVVAQYRPGAGESKPRIKYASAQDLRRTFGTRWAPHVTPQQLQELMRHKSIETTMKYYVRTEILEVERATTKAMQDLPNTSPNILKFKRPA